MIFVKFLYLEGNSLNLASGGFIFRPQAGSVCCSVILPLDGAIFTFNCMHSLPKTRLSQTLNGDLIDSYSI